jgi:DNA helicase-2/ATP-dependent DNA helicase PcrA
MPTDFRPHLNPAQWQAVTTLEGPVLVIAGAGSGKTRTIVYRLANLVESGVPPRSIVLLTFTRKAAAAMLHRAAELVGQGLHAVRGGTFHSFAYNILRRHADLLGFPRGISILDQHDIETLLAEAKTQAGISSKDKRFPKRATIAALLSRCRNKEISLNEALGHDYHLRDFHDDLERIFAEYSRLKRTYGAMDYDDLLFELERLLTEFPETRAALAADISHVMVDEYQDTNRVQARITRLLFHPEDPKPNIMAVGDDAQSIYAFRGATVHNILEFPHHYPGTTIIKLEHNYRSTQPILELANHLLAGFRNTFAKKLFSHLEDPTPPALIRTLTDRTQAALVRQYIQDWAKDLPLHEIAILFRAGFQSYHVELELTKANIPFRKFGGMRFAEAAHIKDALAFLRVADNPADVPAWHRILGLVPGVGPKTAARIASAILTPDPGALAKLRAPRPPLGELLSLTEELRSLEDPTTALMRILAYYQPILRDTYPDDYPRREAGLEELLHIAQGYTSRTEFLADVTLETPETMDTPKDAVTLSTVHSAKGLEWDAVLIIDLVEDRFPSRWAIQDLEAIEEERRLLYVACTRARRRLLLFSPQAITTQAGTMPSRPCPFLEDAPSSILRRIHEGMGLSLESVEPPSPSIPQDGGFCRHKIFGRGKIIAVVPPNKYRIHFPGFGLKLILQNYVTLEETADHPHSSQKTT